MRGSPLLPSATARLRRSRDSVVARHRAPCDQRVQLVIGPLPQLGRSRRRPSARGCQAGSSVAERRQIPGTHVLADVAAEDVIADARALLLRNRVLELDGEVRDAARRVQLVGSTSAPVGHASMQSVQAPH